MAPKAARGRGGRGRGRTARSPSPQPMKRQKKADPVKEKSDIVLKYLKDTDNCEVQGPETCRDMLIQALPHALGSGAASDERCPFQANLGGFIGEVITASVAKWQGQVNDAQAAVDAAESEKSQADNALTEATSQVEQQKKVVEDTTAQSKENKEAEKEASKAATAANKEVVNFDAEQGKKAQEKEDAQSVFEDSFLVLKSCDFKGKFPSSKLNTVASLLQSIGTDASMLGALPLALKKKVDERGQFDEMVVEQCETALQNHLAALNDRINNGESMKKSKEAEAEAAAKALENATAKKEASLDALRFAQDVCKGAEIAEKDAKKTVDAKAGAVSKAKAKHAVEESGLEKAQKVQDAFNFLKDRIAAKADDDVAGDDEPPPSPGRLSSLGSAVSGLFFSPTKPEPTEES